MITALFIFICLILITFAYAGIRAAPWVPTKKTDVGRFLQLAAIKPGEKIYDLGCGDGRMIAAAAHAGGKTHGFEISLLPFIIASVRRLFQKNKSHISIRYRDFWHKNLHDADVVYFFLMPKIYARLKEKLEHELKKGTRVISYVWPIKEWAPEQVSEVKGFPKMYLYIIK